MKLQQLRFLCSVVDAGFSISVAARTLYTSQPGISRQIGLLEDELSVLLLVRRGNRILGLTEAGLKVVERARTALEATEAIRGVAQDVSTPTIGRLTIATTHTHARFSLVNVIREFAKRYPNVDVRIQLGLPQEIADRVASGDADVGIATRPVHRSNDVAMARCYDVEHCLIAQKTHPLLKQRRLSIENIARHPMIAYDAAHEMSRLVMQKMGAVGMAPNIVMHANDSDVIKTYVAAGLGVAIIPTLAFDAKTDRNLRSRPLSHLFEKTIAYAIMRRTVPMRGYVYDLLRAASPLLTRTSIDAALSRHGTE